MFLYYHVKLPHSTHATIELLQRETPEFIPAQLCLQIRQISIHLITACGKYCKRRCTKDASLIWMVVVKKAVMRLSHVSCLSVVCRTARNLTCWGYSWRRLKKVACCVSCLWHYIWWVSCFVDSQLECSWLTIFHPCCHSSEHLLTCWWKMGL